MKKVILFILMIALVVTCAVSGIAFAGSSLNRDYDVTYDAKFTADATTQNPGYLVFDKPVSGANGTITMTMDVIAGTNLTGKFNFGFALLTSPNGNALTDSNSMAWYNSATTISGSLRGAKVTKTALLLAVEKVCAVPVLPPAPISAGKSPKELRRSAEDESAPCIPSMIELYAALDISTSAFTSGTEE